MEIPKTTEWDAYRLDTRVPQIAYGHWLKFFYGYYDRAEAFLISLIKARGCRTVLEVGAGANPTLSGSQIKTLGLRYISSDVDQAELDKAAQHGEARCVDLEGDNLPADIVGSCDLVFSKMVNEHVRDGKKYHTNIRHLLSPNGLAVHLSASLFSLPFVVNRLVPDSVSDMLLRLFGPRDRHQHGKFSAYYSWCRGPTRRMILSFERLGYDVVFYGGYFGHGYYVTRMPWLDRLEQAKARALVSHPLPQLCSYLVLILRRQDATQGPQSGL